jgi:hypothetical protein
LKGVSFLHIENEKRKGLWFEVTAPSGRQEQYIWIGIFNTFSFEFLSPFEMDFSTPFFLNLKLELKWILKSGSWGLGLP